MADKELVLAGPRVREIAYPEELIDVSKTYLLEARAKSTREAYARQWASFTAWCDAQGWSALAASPETIVPGWLPWRRALVFESLVREQRSTKHSAPCCRSTGGLSCRSTGSTHTSQRPGEASPE